jgi:hypothetical protein
MRINRRFLYVGVFLIAIGGVLVAADAGGIDSGALASGLRLWPLAIVALGIGIVARRTRFSLHGGLLAAAVPGLVLGGGFALVPRAMDCGTHAASQNGAAREGMFDGPARISVTTGCGSLVVTTAPGGAWRFDTGIASGREPIVDASARSLSIDAGGREGWRGLGRGRGTWILTLPTTAVEDLSLVVSAGEGRIGLPGAHIGHLDVTTNAAQTTVDLSGASVASLSGSVNAGMLSVRLPAAADVLGSMVVNAGALEVCVPNELGLRVRHTGALSGFSVNGLHQKDANWQNSSYASAAHRADLDIEINLGNVKINPIGGCR